MDKAKEKMRTDYFIGYGLPAKVTHIETQVEVLTYQFETGDFVPNGMSLATLYMSHDDIERVSEREFEAYVANLRELCHLEVPRYYIIAKLPVKVIPVNDRYPDVRKFNIETDEFDVILSYLNLVGLSGEIERVTSDEFERYLEEIRDWYAHLQAPKYYIVGRQPMKIVPADDGKLKLLGYHARNDSFIPSEWKWSSLIPPVNPRWVSEVSENEFRQQLEIERNKFHLTRS
jgi:hypothetical protein